MLALMSIGRLFSLLQPFPPSLLGEGRHVAFVVCQIVMNISEFLTNCDGKVKVKVKYISSSWLYVKIQTIKVHIINKKAYTKCKKDEGNGLQKQTSACSLSQLIFAKQYH